MRELSNAERARLCDEVAELTIRIARQLAGVADTPDPDAAEREVRLAVLAAAQLVQTAAVEQTNDAAYRAALAGASYADMGTAVHLTRQGARKRWPHLAAMTRTARSNSKNP